MVLVAWLKSCFKYWVLCVWVFFISLLASEAELVPKLRPSEACREEEKKLRKLKRKIAERKEREEDLNRKQPLSFPLTQKDGGGRSELESHIDHDETEERIQVVCIEPERLSEDTSSTSVVESQAEEEWQGQEDRLALEEEEEEEEKEECVEASLTLGSLHTKLKEEGERPSGILVGMQKTKLLSDDKQPLKAKPRIGNANQDKSAEEEDEDEVDDIPWIGVGRGMGLARYSGVQNLLAHTETTEDEPLIVEKRAPILAPRREGPLLLPRSSLIRNLSQERERLEEIPEEGRQQLTLQEETTEHSSDKIWAELVARYAEDSIPPDHPLDAEPQMERTRVLSAHRSDDSIGTFHSKLPPEPIREFTDENMMSKEFSAQVGQRLHMYLARLEEQNVKETAKETENISEDEAREIEDDVLGSFDMEENGRDKIFIMIEDEESNEEREQIVPKNKLEEEDGLMPLSENAEEIDEEEPSALREDYEELSSIKEESVERESATKEIENDESNELDSEDVEKAGFDPNEKIISPDLNNECIGNSIIPKESLEMKSIKDSQEDKNNLDFSSSTSISEKETPKEISLCPKENIETTPALLGNIQEADPTSLEDFNQILEQKTGSFVKDFDVQKIKDKPDTSEDNLRKVVDTSHVECHLMAQTKEIADSDVQDPVSMAEDNLHQKEYLEKVIVLEVDKHRSEKGEDIGDEASEKGEESATEIPLEKESEDFHSESQEYRESELENLCDLDKMAMSNQESCVKKIAPEPTHRETIHEPLKQSELDGEENKSYSENILLLEKQDADPSKEIEEILDEDILEQAPIVPFESAETKINDTQEGKRSLESEKSKKELKSEEMEPKEVTVTETNDSKDDIPVFTVKLRRRSKPVIVPEEPVVEELPEVSFNIPVPVRKKSKGEDCLRKKAIENLRRKNSGESLPLSNEMRENLINEVTKTEIGQEARQLKEDEPSSISDSDKTDEVETPPSITHALTEVQHEEGKAEVNQEHEPKVKEVELIEKDKVEHISDDGKTFEEKDLTGDPEGIKEGTKSIKNRGNERGNNSRGPFLLKRQSSRDLWKMECDKILEGQAGVVFKDTKEPDVFSTRYEEFPEDYVSIDPAKLAEIPSHEDLTDEMSLELKKRTREILPDCSAIIDEAEVKHISEKDLIERSKEKEEDECSPKQKAPGTDSEATPKPAELSTVSNLLTMSEQDLVARILAQKSKEDDNPTDLQQSELQDEMSTKETPADETAIDKKVCEAKDSRDESLSASEDHTAEKDTSVALHDTSANLHFKSDQKDVVKPVEKGESSRSEKELMLDLIRLERGSEKRTLSDEEIPDYLEEVKDLLVPRVRRKKAKKRLSAATGTLLEAGEPEGVRARFGQGYLKPSEGLDHSPSAKSEDRTTSAKDEFLLTEEESMELEEMNKEQEAYRQVQRKELEKYLAMPDALTEQEQRELEEILAEEETHKAVTAASEARLEALLAEVRKRLGDSDDEENLDRFLDLPIGLSEEEERLLFEVGEEEEKGLKDFQTEDEYREYLKQKYLDELEEERLRVEEEEMELSGYYDDYDYGDYEDDDYQEDDCVLTDEGKALKDEAVGSDDPMESFESEEGKVGKNRSFGLPHLKAPRRSTSRGSNRSLERNSKDSSREGSVEDEVAKGSKKFFRFGGLSVKRKKKSRNDLAIGMGIEGKERVIEDPSLEGSKSTAALSEDVSFQVETAENNQETFEGNFDRVSLNSAGEMPLLSLNEAVSTTTGIEPGAPQAINDSLEVSEVILELPPITEPSQEESFSLGKIQDGSEDPVNVLQDMSNGQIRGWDALALTDPQSLDSGHAPNQDTFPEDDWEVIDTNGCETKKPLATSVDMEDDGFVFVRVENGARKEDEMPTEQGETVPEEGEEEGASTPLREIGQQPEKTPVELSNSEG